jgi:hypothetical protein
MNEIRGVLCCKITLNSFGSHVSLHPGDWKEKKRHVVTGIVQRSEAPNLYSIIEKPTIYAKDRRRGDEMMLMISEE